MFSVNFRGTDVCNLLFSTNNEKTDFLSEPNFKLKTVNNSFERQSKNEITVNADFCLSKSGCLRSVSETPTVLQSFHFCILCCHKIPSISERIDWVWVGTTYLVLLLKSRMPLDGSLYLFFKKLDANILQTRRALKGSCTGFCTSSLPQRLQLSNHIYYYRPHI